MDEDREEWKPVEGHSGRYMVSSFGRVAKLLTGTVGKTGYRVVCLSGKPEEKLYGVHQVVATAFIGPANGLWVHHRDNSKTNNKLANLEYVTPQENTVRAFDDGVNFRGSKHHSAKLKSYEVKQIRRLCEAKIFSQEEIAKIFGVHQMTVSGIHTRKTWRVEI